ncbi:MAG TPA: DUF488 domain-containing protein [Desulfosalsimonadaceae bacterium]|nr:DUF488 domain-containing protein [Desulfosalsimonadaceae bacterium]
MPRIRLKRVYEKADQSDGRRILVDRVWPRGISRAKARIDYWAKDAAPSNELRKWYGHDPEKWEAFKTRYIDELKANPEAVKELLDNLCRDRTTTFVYSSKEAEKNNAVVLKEFIEQNKWYGAPCKGI